MKVLGINAVFHDPAAALVVDGTTVAAAEEERFSRRKHGKRPVPFSAWELPVLSARWCLDEAGIGADELDAVGYSFDPGRCAPADELGLDDPWDWLRQDYARRAPAFLAEALPGLDPAAVRFVPHHVAHAASAALAAPYPPDEDIAVLVLDGRGEAASHLAGRYRHGRLEVLAGQRLPHSLGLLYEDLTAHLGFLRSSDEYKVMALASYGQPRFLPLFRELVQTTADGGFRVAAVDWAALAKPRHGEDDRLDPEHADLAASVQRRLEEVLLELAAWLHDAAGGPARLAMAGGVALNCVANARLAEQGPYQRVWVQPAAGDAGTALGAALHLSAETDVLPEPMPGADLGRGFPDAELEAELIRAALPYDRPADLAAVVAQVLAGNGVVAWYDGRAEYGPRALGHRSLLANPGDPATTARLNDIKGREHFRPVAPMVLAGRAAEIFEGQLPSPYMLFTHRVRDGWRERIPAVVHVDGTARVQTVDPAAEPRMASVLAEFDRRTGLPVLVNTSLNIAGQPIVDTPRQAMELFGAAPVALLVLGPYTVRRAAAFGGG
ncbi:carbamoyltransferase family protein [Catellatospora bangladeshensis]|uniref:Carbamoyltransferase n=1 Tax=Catellatospora bangladeshensis TaxID=310355 RepID=A0A8J3JQ15_9ACTN|nr:carbamoyltransferase C-terminal domain-containing protein [Catellatospora bangladeshensis]GIF82920.1 carbamoyltransferase [Catellatospora bangladeshensis]